MKERIHEKLLNSVFLLINHDKFTDVELMSFFLRQAFITENLRSFIAPNIIFV